MNFFFFTFLSHLHLSSVPSIFLYRMVQSSFFFFLEHLREFIKGLIVNFRITQIFLVFFPVYTKGLGAIPRIRLRQGLQNGEKFLEVYLGWLRGGGVRG